MTLKALEVHINKRMWNIRLANGHIVLTSDGLCNEMRYPVNCSIVHICTAMALTMFADVVFRSINTNTHID